MVKEEFAKGLEYIYHPGETIAIIVRRYFESNSTIFFTPNSLLLRFWKQVISYFSVKD